MARPPFPHTVNLQFAIPAWAACGPGLSTPAQWQAWSTAPGLPSGEPQPALAQVPPMVRRRLNTLGRTALQAAFDVDAAPGVPVVFASRYGDSGRGLDLLGDLVRGEPLSPTGFGLAVHNAIAATYAIVRGDHASQQAVAAGPDSAVAALVEAAGLLADGAPEVLVLYAEGPLPPDYAVFEDEPSALYAWAWRVCAPVAGAPAFTLQYGEVPDLPEVSDPPDASPVPPALPVLPAGLDLLRVVAAPDAASAHRRRPAPWTWRRHHA